MNDKLSTAAGLIKEIETEVAALVGKHSTLCRDIAFGEETLNGISVKLATARADLAGVEQVVSVTVEAARVEANALLNEARANVAGVKAVAADDLKAHSASVERLRQSLRDLEDVIGARKRELVQLDKAKAAALKALS